MDMTRNPNTALAEIEQLVAQCKSLQSAPIIEATGAALQGNKLAAALKRAGLHVIVIDRAPVYNKETLLHALYQNTPFPGYFGFNWDALQDVLADFSWLHKAPAGIALLLKDTGRFKTNAPQDWDTFAEIVGDVSALWARKRNLPFHLIAA